MDGVHNLVMLLILAHRKEFDIRNRLSVKSGSKVDFILSFVRVFMAMQIIFKFLDRAKLHFLHNGLLGFPK